MRNFFLIKKAIFFSFNFSLIFLYLFPGSVLGWLIYGNKKIQPQITPDFMISSNHFYVFAFLSILGFFAYVESIQSKILLFYLIFLSIILEVSHLIIPERSFQWADLFGNFLGVVVVFFIRKFINKYVVFKK